MTPREKAIKLTERYKELEKLMPKASIGEMNRIREEVAWIAAEMYRMGYSMGRLLKKRQERESHDNKNKSTRH